MKKYINISVFAVALLLSACKKQLDVRNPNQPTPESAQNEQGLLSIASGGVYINGFFNLKFADGVFGRFWPGMMGFHEIMGDVIGAEAANSYMNQFGNPDKVMLNDPGNTILLNPGNPKTQYELCRFANNNNLQGSNYTFYEWAYMYNLIISANNILNLSTTVPLSGDAATKKATIQAWAYFWKGFAYSRIGSTYYAGIIQNDAGFTQGTPVATNGNYITKEAIITEATKNFDQAITLLTPLTANADYNAVINRLIPDYCRVGTPGGGAGNTNRGGTITPAMWIRTINTLKARNILVNTPAATMTAANWNNIITLCNNGIQSGDIIFTGRSNANGDFLGTGISVADKVSSSAAGANTYKLSERWVQDFDTTNDRRYKQNVRRTAVWLGNSDRGSSFNTRFALIDGGTGLFPSTKVYARGGAGANEISIAGSYEENQLMLAEAKVYTSAIDNGMLNVDAARTYQGAGLSAVGNGLTQADAITLLRKERRVALAFQGLSFYDARRWGVTEPMASGGGRTNAWHISASGAFTANATIEYRFLDYWDVPDNELVYNRPASGSAPVKNPKQ
jgi:starch-binding outer membrane protein, SusD/RagB family